MTKGVILLILGVVVLIALNGFFIMALNYEDSSDNGKIKLSQKGSESLVYLGDNSEDEVEDIPITGNTLERASASALQYIGEGRVTDTEIGDEEGYYEIEITLNDGRQVDVHLNEGFEVLSIEYDEEDDD